MKAIKEGVKVDEKQLIEALKKGSEDAMREVMKSYGCIVKYIAVQIIGRDHLRDIEECISDVFYDLWVNINGYDPSKGTLKGYIIGITKHKALNRYRILVKERERNLPLDEEFIAIQPVTEDQVIKKIEDKMIKSAVNEMTEPERTIFIKRYFEGKRIKNIASALGLDTKFVENKLYREKKNLKQKLKERGIRY